MKSGCREDDENDEPPHKKVKKEEFSSVECNQEFTYFEAADDVKWMYNIIHGNKAHI